MQASSETLPDGPRPIEIYVDADACPVKDEIYKVAGRHGLKVHVVANTPIGIPREPWIERVLVPSGLNIADDWIAERVGRGDIVVTAGGVLVYQGRDSDASRPADFVALGGSDPKGWKQKLQTAAAGGRTMFHNEPARPETVTAEAGESDEAGSLR